MSEIMEVGLEAEVPGEFIARDEEANKIPEKTDSRSILKRWKNIFSKSVPEYEVRCLWQQQFFTEHR